MTISDVQSTTARALLERYFAVRHQTEALCAPLETEDYVVSSMPDVSPTKWHLAHTSWFFETFVLAQFDDSYVSPNPKYAFLFNSYYVQAGERHCRAQRGLVTRPTVAEVIAYRAHVDAAMSTLIDHIAGDAEHPAVGIIELGLHHEQQHQELMLTDVKHVFWTNPMRPAYAPRPRSASGDASPAGWRTIAAGIHRIGHEGRGFSFDNETPSHRVFVDDFRIGNRLVTNGEYLQFIEDRGYHRPELWLSNGWAKIRESGWEAPMYWERSPEGWTEFSLAGMHPLDLAEPVCHVSHYEADAFARWAGARLPTEPEWEIAARDEPVDGAFVEGRNFHPVPAMRGDGLRQLYGDVWQWTQSAYLAYPGYTSAAGAIGEYNGKWMSDQWVLRGASCATPKSHARVTYRNFFPSDARWQFMGIRLAANA
jgi:ergothioneine biosynthesis protein EgtB